MPKTPQMFILAVLLAALSGAPSGAALAYTGQELEKEGGGSGLRYSFDQAGTKTYEVGVDAQTGAVLENKAEGPHPTRGARVG